MITKEELAARLNGREYRNEITNEEIQLAKENNLIVIFGASDDLCEVRGAINDEIGCYDGGDIIIKFDKGEKEFPITMQWCPEHMDCSWNICTKLPHAKFNIYEDDNDGKALYCIGIVIDYRTLL